MPFVKAISHNLYNKIGAKKRLSFVNSFEDFNQEDFSQYGIFGLIKAIDEYDFTKKTEFKSYAYIKIIGSIKDGIREDMFFSGLRKKKGEKIPFVCSLETGFMNLDCGEYRYFCADNLEDKRATNPLEKSMNEDSISYFLNNGFSKKDYQIFRDYELNEFCLKEAGLRAGVTEGRASQIHSAILKSIKQEVKDKNLSYKDFI